MELCAIYYWGHAKNSSSPGFRTDLGLRGPCIPRASSPSATSGLALAVVPRLHCSKKGGNLVEVAPPDSNFFRFTHNVSTLERPVVAVMLADTCRGTRNMRQHAVAHIDAGLVPEEGEEAGPGLLPVNTRTHTLLQHNSHGASICNWRNYV